MKFVELQLDRLIGPSHHYGGLSHGNLASTESRHEVSSPRRAALQGLAKMKFVANLGIPQGILPPQQRPHIGFLRDQGFEGSDDEVIQQAVEKDLQLLTIAFSSSAMWMANAATVSPSPDTADGRVHITPANLWSMPHRKIEAHDTTLMLRQTFSDEEHFVVHDPLRSDSQYADEGAANHTRLCDSHGKPGIELFVYGRDGDATSGAKYPARQTLAASQQIARQHGLDDSRVVFAKQNPSAINAGAFHNDVVSVGNEYVHLMHEFAFCDQEKLNAELSEKFDGELVTIEVSNDVLTLEEAVRTYLFNSQLLTIAKDEMLLLCPIECERSAKARKVLDQIKADDNPINRIEFVDLTESMKNGGGPACLRLRVVLSEEQLGTLPRKCNLTSDRIDELTETINANYPETLTVDQLANL